MAFCFQIIWMLKTKLSIFGDVLMFFLYIIFALSQAFKFSSIRVDNPVVLVVNKKKLSSNRLAPSTLLVTTKSEWINKWLTLWTKISAVLLAVHQGCSEASDKLMEVIQGKVHLQEINLLSKETPSVEFYGKSDQLVNSLFNINTLSRSRVTRT